MKILTRAEPIVIQRPDGRCYRISPPTRGQVREIKVLDNEGYDSPEQLDDRIARQLHILGRDAIEVDADTGEAISGEKGLPFDDLTGDEEREILWAIMANHAGENPQTAVAVHRLLKKKAEEETAIASSSDSTPSP